MTHSSSTYNTPRQNKPPDPITTTGLSKGSLNSSSTLSVSPSASVLLSSSSRPSRNNNRSSKTPTSTTATIIPQQSTSSVSSNNRNTKLEQIIQNFYTKTAQIIIQSRISNERLSGGKRKINKWFNITTNDCEKIKDELRFWKSFIRNNQEEQPPPLIIDIYLETTAEQKGDEWHKSSSGVQSILIESWTLSLNHPLPDFPVDLPNLYKRSIVFFRSLHSLVRLLPSHSLYRKLNVHDGDTCLGYRLSTHSLNQPLDRPYTMNTAQQLYEFKEVVTPLGTFKLKLLYRENFQFDKKSEPTATTTAPLPGVIDVDENYFTPTMTKYRQEQIKETIPTISKPSNIYPSNSTSSSSSTSKSRFNSHRIYSTTSATTISNRYPTASTSSTTNALERRISAPLVQPFKSPSLSSSPQAELMYASRSQTPERSRPESGSFGRKIEFSSSFEKFKSANSSNNSSSHNINRATISSNTPAPDIMRRWSRTSDHSSINLEFEEDEEELEDFMKFITVRQELKLFQQQQQQQQQSTMFAPQQQQENEDSKKSLNHFKNIQETHNILSDSMMSFSISQNQSKEPSSSYDSSSSSLNKVPNLPTKPSPLHNTESAVSPRHLPPQNPVPQQQQQQRQQRTLDEFFSSYNTRSQPHHTQLTAHQAEIVAQSPLKNRQAPPPPPPPFAPVRRISGSAGLGDDDDSLVFKMSELSSEYEEEENSLQRLKKIDNSAMRRIHSSGNIPSANKMEIQQSEHYSDDGKSTTTKTRQRIYFDDL